MKSKVINRIASASAMVGLFCFALVSSGAGIWLLLSPTQYQAKVMVINGMPSDQQGQGYGMPGPADPVYFEIIRSPLVLSNVVNSLNLNVEWGKKYGDGSPLKTTTVIEMLQRRMNFQAEHNFELIAISVKSERPDEAARLANTIADDYCEFQTKQFQAEKQEIKARQENLEQLGKQLNLPNPEPAEDLLKSKYPSYFRAKQELQEIMSFHKSAAAEIDDDKLDMPIPYTSKVEVVERAVPPSSPNYPNRLLGIILLACGLASVASGFYLLSFSDPVNRSKS
jgi:capsular polysaccharide biosynthesis protein